MLKALPFILYFELPNAREGGREGFTCAVTPSYFKQCHQFKKRALLVKEGLENGVPGITVKINPEKKKEQSS
ncbi:hypothetical protein ACLOJK_030667 [Asimina triloba]